APARREQAWDGSTVRFRSTEFIPFLPCRSICSLKRNQRNGKNGMNSVLQRSNLGGARQLVRNHEQTGALAPSENGRLPPVLAHQLASAQAFPGRRKGPRFLGSRKWVAPSALTISISRCLNSSASRPQILTIRARSGSSVWDVGRVWESRPGSKRGNKSPIDSPFLERLFPPCCGSLKWRTPFHGGNRHGLPGYFVRLGHAM